MNEEFKFDWDTITIQISKENKVHGVIEAKKDMLESYAINNKASLADVIEMLVKALETTPIENKINNNTDAIS